MTNKIKKRKYKIGKSNRYVGEKLFLYISFYDNEDNIIPIGYNFDNSYKSEIEYSMEQILECKYNLHIQISNVIIPNNFTNVKYITIQRNKYNKAEDMTFESKLVFKEPILIHNGIDITIPIKSCVDLIETSFNWE